MTPLQEAAEAAAKLLVFRDICAHPLTLAWQELIQQLMSGDPLPCWAAYGRWFEQLARQGLSWRQWLIREIRWADNPFARAALQPQGIPEPLMQAARHDLRCLQTLADSQETIAEQMQALGLGIPWPDGETDSAGWDPRSFADWGQSLETLIAHYRQRGVGLCGRYWAFRWGPAGLEGIPAPDLSDWEEIYGYERQKQQLAANTEALLRGDPALHVLLYGARGTGKSSLVKALLRRYGLQGLRLLELRRTDLIRHQQPPPSHPRVFWRPSQSPRSRSPRLGYGPGKAVAAGSLRPHPHLHPLHPGRLPGNRRTLGPAAGFHPIFGCPAPPGPDLGPTAKRLFRSHCPSVFGCRSGRAGERQRWTSELEVVTIPNSKKDRSC
jgi:hypothetical protein